MARFFSRLRGRDGGKKSKNGNQDDLEKAPAKRWEDDSMRTYVEPEEIQELIRRCTEELKSRALGHPFLLLPFRPASDPSAVRTFIRHFFDPSQNMRGETLAQELRMTEPMVLSGIVKWCWSRLVGGIVGWDAYELFKIGEQDSNMARDSFKTFIPLSVDNGARSCIIFDFFDLMSAIAAHGKANGLGGRKLSRMAAWWAFEHKDNGNGFDGGYKTWITAADATSHLFFAYLRTLAPEGKVTGITLLPMSLQKLLQETEYPPQRPSLMQSSTNKVLMHVDTVSPTPFALLRRANHFQYRDDGSGLSAYAEYEDPVKALTEECRRVLRAISSTNQSQVSNSKHSTSLRDASWSRFEDVGFSTPLEEDEEDDEATLPRQAATGLRSTPASENGLGRPTTPSWADFMSSGFVDDAPSRPTNMLLPPDKALPRIETTVRQRSSQSHRPRLETERHLEPGELASITNFDLDDAFWWVWMCSLAPEETAERKAAFGRCAVIETNIKLAKWLVMEEMVVGSGLEPNADAYIAEKKKGFFSWTRRNKGLNRRKSTGKRALEKGEKGFDQNNPLGHSKTSIGPDQHARIQAAAAQLQAKQTQEERAQLESERRGRAETDRDKTNSVMTLQPAILSEASQAMKWASKYDKEAIRGVYLADSSAGRGAELSPTQTNGHASTNGSVPAGSSLLPPKTPEPQHEPSEQALEVPSDAHSAERAEAASPIPPPKDSVGDAAAYHEVKASLEGSPESKKRGKLHKAPAPAPTPAPAPAPVPAAAAPPPSTGGFKKMFSRRKRASKVPENAAADLNGMIPEREAAATPTPIDVAPAATAAVPSPQPSPARKPVPAPAAPTPAPANSEPSLSPDAAHPEPTYNPSIHSGSEPDADDMAHAKSEFARFDQGPLAEQPAFIPDDSEDDAVPPPIARRARDVSPEKPEKPEKPAKPAAAPPRPSEGPAEPALPPALERWAQIRKNAADRAAQKENVPPPAPAPKQEVADDDTSGEETIESRVARIKARVAELTGNMEDTAGPGARNVGAPAPRPY